MGSTHLYINRANYYEWTPPIRNNSLKDPRLDPSTDNNDAIGSASLSGHLEIVKLLLKDPRVDPSDFSNYSIIVSSMRGHLKIFNLLLLDEYIGGLCPPIY